jgi:hypothetical protein
MKRSRNIVLTICFCLLKNTSFSQTNIDRLLREQPPSDIELIDRARAMLIYAFEQNDRQDVRELHQYLSSNFDEDIYVTLFPDERILLSAWTGDFENMLRSIYKTPGLSRYRSHRFDPPKIMPRPSNDVYETAKERLFKEFDIIIENVQTSSLSQEQKDFLAIYLHYYLLQENRRYSGPHGGRYFYPVVNNDSLIRKVNADTRKFIATYPNSQYIIFLKSYEMKMSDWGGGFGVNIGYSEFTGNLSEHFKNTASIDIYLEMLYKKYVMALEFFSVLGGKNRQDIEHNGFILPKDTSINIPNVYVSLGYKFFENKRIELIPMAGIGTSWIRPSLTDEQKKQNPDLKQFNYWYGLTASLGISADIRLDRMDRVPGHDFAYPSFWMMRISYKFSYNTLRQNIPTFYNGNIHTISVGFRIGGKDIEPVRYN